MAAGPVVPGTISAVTLTNFMQYTSVSFKPGPNLNVIVGPNGSGKSAIVNAICLGLAGKPETLGRGKTAAEFVRTGADEAEISIDLHKGLAGGGVWTVKRSWTTDPKERAKWSVNGVKKNEKEIRAFVTGLNIQTDNLCQFLPQDKVYEFSRMTPKNLLHKTVDAVGEEELQSDHRKLQEWQDFVEDAEARDVIQCFLDNSIYLHGILSRCKRFHWVPLLISIDFGMLRHR